MDSVSKFCNASCNIEFFEENKNFKKVKSQKEASKHLKQIILEEMEKMNETCIKVSSNEEAEPRFARLVERRTAPKVNSDVFIQSLSDLAFDDLKEEMSLQKKNEGACLSNVVSKTIEKKIKAGCEVRKSVSLVKKPAKQFLEAKSLPPALNQTIQDFSSVSEEIMRDSKIEKEKKQPFVKEKKNVEAAVSEHLSKMETPYQRVKIDHKGDVRNYYLKNQTSFKRKKPCLRSSIPILRELLSEVCSRIQIENDLSESGLRTLQKSENIKTLHEKLQASFETMETPQEVKKVKMIRIGGGGA